jgi:hypothetical protein
MAKNKKSVYGYTIRHDVDTTLDDQSGGKFDEKALSRGRADMVMTPHLDRKAMRYLGTDEDNPNFDVTKAGAGRGKKGGPSAKELQEYESKNNSMTAGQKQSMQEAKDEEAYQKRKTAPTTKTEMGKVFAKGGMTASSRADGCAVKGKTKGRFV